jgi:molybdenum cofactor cytidylyltransferase
MEIVTRPQPREEPVATGKRIATVVLAAGRSTRMGGPNKLTAEIGGKPLVRIAVEQALASRAKPVIVVTGHQRESIEAALAGLDVRLVHNPDYAEGLGASLKAGIAAVPPDAAGVVVCLGDMPQVTAGLIRSPRRRLRCGEGCACRRADARRTAWQSGAVVAPVLPRPDGDRRRRRRAQRARRLR